MPKTRRKRFQQLAAFYAVVFITGYVWRRSHTPIAMAALLVRTKSGADQPAKQAANTDNENGANRIETTLGVTCMLGELVDEPRHKYAYAGTDEHSGLPFAARNATTCRG